MSESANSRGVDTTQVISKILLLQVGGGTIAGIAVGYAIKKVSKAALFIIGVIILGLYALMQAHLVTVHWDAVSSGIEAGTRAAGTWASTMVKSLSASLVGFGVGFFVGVKLS